jgi:hypothetical protein
LHQSSLKGPRVSDRLDEPLVFGKQMSPIATLVEPSWVLCGCSIEG